MTTSRICQMFLKKVPGRCSFATSCPSFGKQSCGALLDLEDLVTGSTYKEEEKNKVTTEIVSTRQQILLQGEKKVTSTKQEKLLKDGCVRYGC